MCVQLLSHVQLCDPMDCSPPGSSVHGIFQARVLQCVTISFCIKYTVFKFPDYLTNIIFLTLYV